MSAKQKKLFNLPPIESDVIYTPDVLASDIVKWREPSGKILEPSAGGGAFLNHLPGADWCEIKKGRDFFEYTKKVNWIIGNPPYHKSIFYEWMLHSFSLADNIVYLLPINKMFQRKALSKKINEWGCIYKIRSYGDARANGYFGFGFPVAAFWLVRNAYSKTINLIEDAL